MVYVQRNRRWPLAVAFRPAMTPVAYRLRVLPRFVDADRADDVIETCSKHFDKSSKSTKDRSFIHLLSPLAEYVTDNTGCGLRTTQISVLYPLDVLGLLKRSKIDSASPTEARQDFTDSQSHLLPEVRDMVDCRVNCYNSCFGAHVRVRPEFTAHIPGVVFRYRLLWQVMIHRHCGNRNQTLARSSYVTDHIFSFTQTTKREVTKVSSEMFTSSFATFTRLRDRKPYRKSQVLYYNGEFVVTSQSGYLANTCLSLFAVLGESTLTVDALWTLNPLASPTINVNGSDYFLILVPNRQQWRQLRMLRNCWLSSIDNSGPGRIKRTCRTCDQLELKIAERLRHDPITCSQGSSTPPESSQCDKVDGWDMCGYLFFRNGNSLTFLDTCRWLAVRILNPWLRSGIQWFFRLSLSVLAISQPTYNHDPYQ
ncbi:hypothetical protein CLF_110072 [Clonorchis sinensis]|uniref:p53 DNA-binding domain-containing protein n=1 Tax=Clonorchis sinensis TaxID=79923 RepID=G7YK75_CLOSI|nr:hypothetical protein CLF_110072 [Clonorchis sinensis]